MNQDRAYLDSQGVNLNSLPSGTILQNGSIVGVYEDGERYLQSENSIINDDHTN